MSSPMDGSNSSNGNPSVIFLESVMNNNPETEPLVDSNPSKVLVCPIALKLDTSSPSVVASEQSNASTVDGDNNYEENQDDVGKKTAEEKLEDELMMTMMEKGSTVTQVAPGGEVAASSLFLEVEPTLDFWMVDEELIARFFITTNRVITVIFKIKTTSPFHFWVRPTYGLMKPGVRCCVEVKCDPKIPRARLALDEFFIEAASVPLASTVMTSDLYTSCIPSNLPVLLSIWDTVDSTAVQGMGSEIHKLECRFQGVNPAPNLDLPASLRGDAKIECYLAREFPLDQDEHRASCLLAHSQHQSTVVRVLGFLITLLSLFLLGSLSFIFFW